MSELSNLAYVVINASDLGAWRSYATHVLGMQVGYEEGSTIGFRMDDYPHRLIVRSGPEDDLSVAGWAMKSEDELEAYVSRLRKLSVHVEKASEELTASRRVCSLYRFPDPNGFWHEVFYGIRLAPLSDPFKSPTLAGNAFVTGDLGFGHILPVAKDYSASKRFYSETMGLRLSDYIRQEIAPGIVADATFFHTQTGRHHSLATGQFPSQKILNHFMVEVADMNDVGLAYDRARAADVPIILELGHHPNDQMFSFYMVSPSGFGVELGHGGIVINDDTWEVVEFSQMSDWGHRRLQNTF